MGFFSKFEGRMEDTFEGVANKMFDAPISPVQIAKKAEKMMRREKMVGAGKQFAPTLYTVLVNPDDDQRLFGYYPTLAGETETYLSAKAANEGLVMDGQPLVRFIVDEDLRHGKFDIIAEPVAAPIIAQLRAEEMHRYGLGAAPSPVPGQGGMPGYQPIPAPAQPFGQQDPYAQANPYGQGFDEPLDHNPLPYVPEDELDYSIDYGEYTFDSQDFDDYRENGAAAGAGSMGAAGAGAMGAAAGVGGMGVAAGAGGIHAAQGAYGAGAPDTVVFAAGSGNAAPMPNAHAVRARLINMNDDKSYDLASARFVLGRDRSADIVVDDINASRTHAELRFEPQGVWVIIDLGSTNGTYVNGVETTSQPLQDGDRITIGMTNYLFSLS